MQTFVLSLISPSLSSDELEGLSAWVMSLIGAPVTTAAIPLMERDAGTDAIRIDFEFQAPTTPSIYPAVKQSPTPLHAASLVTKSARVARKRLFAFDMDSTFINQEVIDEIGREIGLYDKFAEITESAMKGQIDFVQALHDRILLLKGLHRSKAEAILPRLTLSPGIESLIRTVQGQGAKTVIISGGFDFVLRHFQLQLGIDTIHAHHLMMDADGNLEGRVQLPIIDGEMKLKLVKEKIAELGLQADEVVIAGDGANDIRMMSAASTQVSFQGKEKLNLATNTWIFDRHYRWLKGLL